MTNIVIQQIEKKFINTKVPVLRSGYSVKVHQKIKEGEKERIQIFEGLVISINSGHGASKMFMVRKIVEGIGVEKIFPLYSPNIAKIEILKTPRVRRAKLFYMRGLAGKSARLRAKLGMIEKDQIYGKKKGILMENMVAKEVEPMVEPEITEPNVAETVTTPEPAEQKASE